MKEKIASFEEHIKEKQPMDIRLEELKEYALRILHDLNQIYLSLYLDIQRIQYYFLAFNNHLGRGQVVKRGMEAIIKTMEELFQWKK